MNASTDSTTSVAPVWFRIKDLVLALLLGLLFLVVSVIGVASEFGSIVRTPVHRGVASQFLTTPAVLDDLVFFAVAQLGLHALLGVFVWTMAIATHEAGLGRSLRRWHLIVLWFVVTAFWIGLANATLFPWSVTKGFFTLFVFDLPGEVSSLGILTTLLGATVLWVVSSAMRKSQYRRIWLRAAVWAAVGVLTLVVLTHLPETVANDRRSQIAGRPNVIVIGIDSLRSDMVGGSGNGWLTPNIDAYLRDARVVSDALTPLARTFPAWVSILTGKHPQATGARENLVSRKRLHVSPTLADTFRANGYRTVFATDEVRFSNIDESYGFDVAVQPTPGAVDFVLGSINDLPLPNLVSNTIVGKLLFPATYANRAAATTYVPETFIENLGPELHFDRPTFLAVHLTLPHWPYHWADEGTEIFERTFEQPYAYLASVVAVDRQFGQLMQLLEERGALTNAIVVVLSDHGEGLGLPADNLIYSKEAKAAAGKMIVWMWGHGTSVLSPHQYSVLLSFRGYGPNRLTGDTRTFVDVPATLEDIAPTVLDLVDVDHKAEALDGRSLAAALREDRGDTTALKSRIRFTETAFSTPSLGQGSFTREQMLEEGTKVFAVNSENGLIEFRENYWSELLVRKERAAVKGDWLLAVLPAATVGEHQYVLVNRRGGLPRRLHSAPDPMRDAEAAALWDALQQRFPGELFPPAD